MTRQHEPLEKLLTADQVAALLSVSSKTIYAWAGAGRLPCVRLGSLLRFEPGEIARWVGDKKEG